MYHFFVRRRIHQVLAHLNAGDLAFVVNQFSPRAEHWFSGSHALGGRRSSGDEIRAWYGRLAAVFPDIQFQLKKLTSSGPPWRTHVAVEWTDSFPRQGLPPNQGVFFITLSWGRVVEFHVYCDTAVLARTLLSLGERGVAEAVATPIGAL